MTDTGYAPPIVGKLLAEEHRGRFMPGGGIIDSNGNGKTWGGEKIMERRNPDGPEAAKQIMALYRALEAAERIVTGDAEACRAFAAPDEEPSEPERVLTIILDAKALVRGEAK